MPRFHFNVLSDPEDLDVDGTEFPNVTAAKREARLYAGRILSDSALVSDPDNEWRIEVTDPTGLVLFRLDITMMDAPATRR
jgi:hypothetical protein